MITPQRRMEIHQKGFKLEPENVTPEPYSPSVDYSKVKVGIKTLQDAIIDLGSYKKVNSELANKSRVLSSIQQENYEDMRQISNYFYKTSGIYSRLCRYLAYLYRYDWYVTPYISDQDNEKSNEKALQGFTKILTLLDGFEIKRFLGDTALKVIRNGCYYGYIVNQDNGKIAIQELPINYCRSRYTVGLRPAVEFNVKFFDDNFNDVEQRIRIINLFPSEFRKAYRLYHQGKLQGDFMGDDSGWYLLDPNYAFKFNINDEDYPFLISVIPAIIELNEAQDLDRKKMEQSLLKLVIQKLPLDKNNDLIFDVTEVKDLHNNAVAMLSKAIGLDVLTTFADTSVADMSDSRTTAASDELERVERGVYNEAGISQMQFNTNGNLALEKSILNDEATIYNLIVQFESFLNLLIEPFNKSPKKVLYKVQILTTTIYNYKEMSKLYKEQTQLGYSKMLPQIALGQSQSSILANAHFENSVLDLVNVFIPPLSTNVMSGDMVQGIIDDNKGQNSSEKTTGRPKKENDEKATKTLQNEESLS